MKLNKTILTGVAALTLFSTGAALFDAQNSTEIVEAKSRKKTTKKLTHNAYVYNSKGKRVKGAKTLKKGRKLRILGYKTIKGKKYARIGKNRYVNYNNFKSKPKAKPTNYSNDPTYKKYNSWLKQREDGVLVANKDTYYTTMNEPDKRKPVEKGSLIEIPDDSFNDETGVGSGAVIIKQHGEYYIQFQGRDEVVNYPAKDFDFNPYKKTSEYRNLVNKYIQTKDGKYKVTVNAPIHYYSTDDNDIAYKAGESFTLTDADIVLNEKGGYSLIGVADDGYLVEIPVNNISSYNLLPKSEDDDDE